MKKRHPYRPQCSPFCNHVSGGHLPPLRLPLVIQPVREQRPNLRRKVGARPSIFARVGPKSTNQSLKIARAIASSVSFMRRLRSILSSSAPRTEAIALLFANGGNGTSIRLRSLSRELR